MQFYKQIPLLVILFLVSCKQLPNEPVLEVTGISDSLQLSDFRVSVAQGDSWIYKRAMILGDDTTVSYSFWEAGADTVIDTDTGLLLTGIEYQKSKSGLIDTVVRKEVLFQSDDTLCAFDFIDNTTSYDYLPISPTRSNNKHYSNMNLDELRNWILSQKRCSSRSSDSEVTSEQTFPLIYPLHYGSTWELRGINSDTNKIDINLTCLGFDTIQNNGLKKTVKIKSKAPILKEYTYFNWYTTEGVERKTFDFDSVMIVDTYGNGVEMVKAEEYYNRIELKDVDQTFFNE